MSEPSLDLAFRMVAEYLVSKMRYSEDGFSRDRETVIRRIDLAFSEIIEEQGHTDIERAAFLNKSPASYYQIKRKIASLKGAASRRKS